MKLLAGIRSVKTWNASITSVNLASTLSKDPLNAKVETFDMPYIESWLGIPAPGRSWGILPQESIY
ncbi:MAG: hypothetical protein V4727_02715 [Verrucomicrobiota bacterium]